MAIIGIMRWNTDNDYLFVAEKQDKDLLTNVSVYHNNTSSVGSSGPSKRSYDQTSILYNGTVLGVGDDRVIFTGNEVFLTYTISNEDFQIIFDHIDDLGKLLSKGKERLKDHSYSPLFGFEKREPRTEEEWVDVCQKYEEMIKQYAKRRPIVPEHMEFDRIVDIAYKKGFDGKRVNGRPRVATGLTEMVLVPS